MGGLLKKGRKARHREPCRLPIMRDDLLDSSYVPEIMRPSTCEKVSILLHKVLK